MILVPVEAEKSTRNVVENKLIKEVKSPGLEIVNIHKSGKIMDIKIIGDYHTHTNIARGHIPVYRAIASTHAKGSLMENAAAAVEKGLKEIAITDHGYKHIIYGMKINEYKQVRMEIDEINSNYNNKNIDFKLLLGTECNIISRSGNIDIDDEILKYLDIICVGYHRGAMQNLNVKNNFTEAAINAIEKYEITILNHPLDHVACDIMEIGRAAAQRNTALEINRSHKNISIEDIKKLKQLGVKFSLGSDSHVPQTIGTFGEAYKIAMQAGLSEDDIINADGKAHKNMKLLR